MNSVYETYEMTCYFLFRSVLRVVTLYKNKHLFLDIWDTLMKTFDHPYQLLRVEEKCRKFLLSGVRVVKALTLKIV